MITALSQAFGPSTTGIDLGYKSTPSKSMISIVGFPGRGSPGHPLKYWLSTDTWMGVWPCEVADI